MTINEILSLRENDSNKEKILETYNYVLKKYDGKKRKNGDDLICHVLNVTYYLAKLNVDDTTIISSLSHELITYANVSEDEIIEKFGQEVLVIIKSLNQISNLNLTDDSQASAIKLRKIVVGLCEDVRVLFIKLADRLHNMKTMDCLSKEHQKFVANETLTVLVPIAHRLGINYLKSELENMSLYYLKPDVYNDILEKLNEKVGILNEHLISMQDSISSLLTETGIKFKIKSRVKSVYSIYNKLSSGKKWDDIYDILALRVFVDKESDCYAVIGAIHSKYRPVPGRFKDYIALPKENMYQSLHTTVFGESDHFYEIQVRTYEMDEIAEKGIASHWSYKEKGSKKIQNMMEQKLELYRNIIESTSEEDTKEFEDVLDSDILSDLIYVFTPKGDVMELPKGSTPIDFAYRVHSKVGETMVGAIINDVMVPIDTELKDNDIVKILTNPTTKPNKDWINMVRTSSAKNKIKAYFSKIDHDEYVTKGKTILEREIRKRKLSINEVLSDENINKLVKNLNLKDLDDIYLSVGSLRYTANYLINYLYTPENSEDALIIKKKDIVVNHKVDILVDGKTNILTHLAKCCNPVKGDDIVGFITKMDGIAIHKKRCINITSNSDKIVDVKWNDASQNSYFTDIYIKSVDGKNILSDLIAIFTKLDIYINKFENNDNSYKFNVKVKNKEECDKILASICKLRYVKEAVRL